MRNRAAVLSLGWGMVLLGLACTAQAAERIRYDVTSDVANKQFEIKITVPEIKGPSVSLQIPTWSPGAYIIGNFAASIADVSAATLDGRALALTHPDKLTWTVETQGAKEIRVTYHVKNSDIEAVNGQPKRAHISGPRTYMYVVNRKTDPTFLMVNAFPEWKVATSLEDRK